jgi:hypothetical protein
VSSEQRAGAASRRRPPPRRTRGGGGLPAHAPAPPTASTADPNRPTPCGAPCLSPPHGLSPSRYCSVLRVNGMAGDAEAAAAAAFDDDDDDDGDGGAAAGSGGDVAAQLARARRAMLEALDDEDV